MLSILLALSMIAAAGQEDDRTAIALERCLASSPSAPVQQQEEPVDEGMSEGEMEPLPDVAPDVRSTCYDNARRSYDRRILKAYRSLLRKSEPGTAEWLSQTNQAWLTYRENAVGDADMAAAARDHALWLEGIARTR